MAGSTKEQGQSSSDGSSGASVAKKKFVKSIVNRPITIEFMNLKLSKQQLEKSYPQATKEELETKVENHSIYLPPFEEKEITEEEAKQKEILLLAEQRVIQIITK